MPQETWHTVHVRVIGRLGVNSESTKVNKPSLPAKIIDTTHSQKLALLVI